MNFAPKRQRRIRERETEPASTSKCPACVTARPASRVSGPRNIDIASKNSICIGFSLCDPVRGGHNRKPHDRLLPILICLFSPTDLGLYEY
jgi:hypothetical protein